MMVAGLIVFLALAVAPVQGEGARREAQAHFERGVELQKKGDFQGARSEYEAALTVPPRRADILSNLGAVYARLGQYDEAIKRYKEALKVDPQQYSARLNLGIAYFQTGDFALAQEALSTVVAAQSDNYQARLLLGLCYFQLNKLNEAASQLEIVYDKQPTDVGAAYALGSVYISLNKLERAQELVNQVFRQLDSAEAHLLMGSLSLAAKNFPKAIEELNQAEQINPRLPTLHSQLGTAYLFSGDREHALKAYANELEINKRDFEANLRLGMLYREDQRLGEAETLLKRALDLRPGETYILYQLALLSQAKGATDEAVKLLEQVVGALPEFTQAHVLLARLYFKLKRLPEAERERAVIDQLNARQQKNQPTNGAEPTPPQQ
jgi:tetratricopeptide (TPR) repeat protein